MQKESGVFYVFETQEQRTDSVCFVLNVGVAVRLFDFLHLLDAWSLRA
jgi:hypothetical protein